MAKKRCDICGSLRGVVRRENVELRVGVAGWINAVCRDCLGRLEVTKTKSDSSDS